MTHISFKSGLYLIKFDSENKWPHEIVYFIMHMSLYDEVTSGFEKVKWILINFKVVLGVQKNAMIYI